MLVNGFPSRNVRSCVCSVKAWDNKCYGDPSRSFSEPGSPCHNLTYVCSLYYVNTETVDPVNVESQATYSVGVGLRDVMLNNIQQIIVV